MTLPISSSPPSSAQGLEHAFASGNPKPGGKVTGPTLNAGQPYMLALGLEGLIALLSEEGAKHMRKDARDNQRAERDVQIGAIQRQVGELYEKASAMRKEAAVAAAIGIAGGVVQVAGNANGGKAIAELASPVSKFAYGGQQIEHEANATRAAADAKRAESAAEEYGALVKNADATIDKAHQALQALVQMRAQLNANHGVYRAM
jgi:hypothetical protein